MSLPYSVSIRSNSRIKPAISFSKCKGKFPEVITWMRLWTISECKSLWLATAPEMSSSDKGLGGSMWSVCIKRWWRTNVRSTMYAPRYPAVDGLCNPLQSIWFRNWRRSHVHSLVLSIEILESHDADPCSTQELREGGTYRICEGHQIGVLRKLVIPRREPIQIWENQSKSNLRFNRGVIFTQYRFNELDHFCEKNLSRK